MTENMILSRLFATGCEFVIESSYGSDIEFAIGDRAITYGGGYLLVWNKDLEKTRVEFSEIKEIKITEKTITLIMQYSGYNFKDGDKKVLRRFKKEA